MSSKPAINRSFFSQARGEEEEQVSEHEVYPTSISICFGMQMAAPSAKRGKGRCGIRSLNRILKIW